MRESNSCAEWRVRVAEYRRSGLAASKWCDLNGCSIHTLRYWITRINKLTKDSFSSPETLSGQNDDNSWASVKIVDENTNSQIAIFIGCARIEVTSGFDKSLLSDVLEVVGKSC